MKLEVFAPAIDLYAAELTNIECKDGRGAHYLPCPFLSPVLFVNIYASSFRNTHMTAAEMQAA